MPEIWLTLFQQGSIWEALGEALRKADWWQVILAVAIPPVAGAVTYLRKRQVHKQEQKGSCTTFSHCWRTAASSTPKCRGAAPSERLDPEDQARVGRIPRKAGRRFRSRRVRAMQRSCRDFLDETKPRLAISISSSRRALS